MGCTAGHTIGVDEPQPQRWLRGAHPPVGADRMLGIQDSSSLTRQPFLLHDERHPVSEATVQLSASARLVGPLKFLKLFSERPCRSDSTTVKDVPSNSSAERVPNFKAELSKGSEINKAAIRQSQAIQLQYWTRDPQHEVHNSALGCCGGIAGAILAHLVVTICQPAPRRADAAVRDSFQFKSNLERPSWKISNSTRSTEAPTSPPFSVNPTMEFTKVLRSPPSSSSSSVNSRPSAEVTKAVVKRAVPVGKVRQLGFSARRPVKRSITSREEALALLAEDDERP